jgi:hypothetical protein
MRKTTWISFFQRQGKGARQKTGLRLSVFFHFAGSVGLALVIGLLGKAALQKPFFQHGFDVPLADIIWRTVQQRRNLCYGKIFF